MIVAVGAGERDNPWIPKRIDRRVVIMIRVCLHDNYHLVLPIGYDDLSVHLFFVFETKTKQKIAVDVTIGANFNLT